jgi:formate--tetrahydrofolate ligase
MASDIETPKKGMKPIEEIAKKLGIEDRHIEKYGRYIAKISLEAAQKKEGKKGKLIIVTAMTPTPAGEGKTTTSVGLADALSLMGKKAVAALREPSLGPVLGLFLQMK